jgi:hypothetical protein
MKLDGLDAKALRMCGIAGFFGRPDSPLPNAEILDRMIGAIAHRGPDASDYVSDVLSSDALSAMGLFEPCAVERLVRKCAAQPLIGVRDNAAFVGALSTRSLRRHFVGTNASIPSSSLAA